MWKVLVVDDEQEVREMMKDALHTIQPGVTVVEAPNGADGLWKLNNDSFQVVITDLKMPKGGGATILNAYLKKMLDPKRERDLKQIIIYSGVVEDMPKINSDKIKLFLKGTDDGKLISHLTQLFAS